MTQTSDGSGLQQAEGSSTIDFSIAFGREFVLCSLQLRARPDLGMAAYLGEILAGAAHIPCCHAPDSV